MASEALIALLALLAVGALVGGLIYLAAEHRYATVALLLGVWIATIALRDSVDLSLTAAGIRVTALDLLLAILLIVALARVLTGGVGGLGGGLLLGLAGLLAIHVARGIAEFDLETAVNDSRSWFYFAAPALYAATAPRGWDARLWKLLIGAGILLVLLAIPAYLADGIGAANEVVLRDGEWVTSRPVVATGALVVLQAAILSLALRWPNPKASLAVVGLLATTVIALQHRTVWVAALVTAVAGFAWWSVRQTRAARPTVFAATGLAILLVPFAAAGLAQTGPLVDSAREVTAEDSTFAWRVTGWEELVSSRDSLAEVTSGQAAGAGQSREIHGNEVDVSAHNGLVEAYVRFGLLGVIVVVCIGALLWRRRHALAPRVGLTPTAIGLLVLTQLLFLMAYSLDAVQGIVTGALVAGLLALGSSQPQRTGPEHA